ncbi:hypothetical protein Pla110_22580 [Polystyrenella longa]|uniref:DUF202 domain-containing protein n=1 Tax=Polystyrenella longa TaxID=2528007 RepID=A0A518CMS3_9PLAN|nr:DUF202 domain-containing protein [Polystyrenella longa]QDU80527.1 hypothetical protein Pla110_22580 [Polystyrenella longa]
MNSSPSSSDLRNQLAEERTEAAIHRTFLSEQRTYSSWVRTGLASTATGFAIAKLMTEAEPFWLVRLLASIFVIAGALMFLLAFWAYRDAINKLQEGHSISIPQWVLAILSMTLFATACAGLYLIEVNPG